jgi:membrane protease YdiL (CAAX protease family)
MYSIGLFAFPPLLVAWFFSGKIFDYLKLNKRPDIFLIILSAIIVVAAFPIINFLIEMNGKVSFPDSLSTFENLMKELENEAQRTTLAFLSTDSFSVYLVNILVMAVIPALGEELLFRGVFQRLFHEWSKNIHVAIWISAFLFSAMHMQFYGLIPRMVLGAFLGYLFYWSGSLWLPIIAHFINNGIAVTMFYVKGEVAEKAETIGTEEGVSMLLFTSIIIVSALIYSFYRVSKEKKIKLAASNAINESDD